MFDSPAPRYIGAAIVAATMWIAGMGLVGLGIFTLLNESREPSAFGAIFLLVPIIIVASGIGLVAAANLLQMQSDVARNSFHIRAALQELALHRAAGDAGSDPERLRELLRTK